MPGLPTGLPFALGEAPVAPPNEVGVEEAPPIENAMAREAYDALEPITADDGGLGYPLLALVRAIASMFAQVEEAIRAREGFDAWERVFNPDAAPAWLLPFIAQAVGVELDTSLSVEAQVAQIKGEHGWHRGRPESLLERVAATLTGAKRIRLIERNSTAWKALIVTGTTETPTPGATEKAALLEKPGGIILQYETSDLPLIDEGTKTIDEATVGTIDEATLAEVT